MPFNPPSHTPFTWIDEPSVETPLDAANLIGAEVDLVGYTQSALEIFDAYNEALYAAQAALLSGLTEATTLTTTGTLAANAYTPCNATSAAFTVSMPATSSLAYGALVAAEKIDSSANVVTVSGTFRGAAGTITLQLAHETIVFFYEGNGSFRPLASHKTLSSLDARYDAAGSAATAQATAEAASIPLAQKAATNGVATLTGTTLTSSQLPTSVVNGSSLAAGPVSTTIAGGVITEAQTPFSTIDEITYDTSGRMSTFRETITATAAQTNHTITYDTSTGLLASVS